MWWLLYNTSDIESLYWITETNEVICQLYLNTNNKGYHVMMTLLYIFLSIMCSITMAHTILNVPIVDIRDVFYNRESSEWFVTVVLNWRWPCPLGYIWVYLDAYLVVTIGVYYCNLVGRGHGSCQIPYNAQDRPLQKSVI